MTARTLVLGTAVGYDFRHMAPFVKSLRATGYLGQIALVVGNVDPLTCRLLRRYDVVLVSAQDADLIEAGLPHGLTSGRADILDILDILDIQTSRYLLYAGYVDRIAADVDEVLIADVRDVFFQRPPFDHDHDIDTLSCAVEERTIGSCEHNTAWILEAFGRTALERLSDGDVLCSGTTLGSTRCMQRYLRAMIRVILERPTSLRGVDQGIHNYVIRAGLVDGVRLCANRDGPFLTLDGSRAWSLTETHEVLAPGGMAAPIVHQFDRHPALEALAERRFAPGWLLSRVLKSLGRRTRRRAACPREVDHRRLGDHIVWLTKPDRSPGGFWEADFLQALLDADDAPDCLVFSSNDVGTAAVEQALAAMPGRVLIHLSDEWTLGGEAPSVDRSREFARVYERADHVFRQYAMHPDYVDDHISFLPLGYMTGMFRSLPTAPPAGPRAYRWAFAGEAGKQDRPDMIHALEPVGPHRIQSGLSPRDVGRLYADALFVPVGRGNACHDCFRIYEASLCGAVPVLVIDEATADLAFGPMRALAGEPPWMFCDTWTEAAERVRDLSEAEARARGHACFDWVSRAIDATRGQLERLGRAQQQRARRREDSSQV